MTRAFKFLSIGFLIALATLGVAYYYDHVTRKEPIVFVVDEVQTNHMTNLEPVDYYYRHRNLEKLTYSNHAIYTDVTQQPGKEVVTVTNTFNVRGTNELRMMLLMTETLATLGIEKDEATVRQLVLARVKADWSTTPQHFRDVPDWAPNQAFSLKRKISRLLETEDEEAIRRILECPIGPEIPPMVDYVVRKDVWEEIGAIKK